MGTFSRVLSGVAGIIAAFICAAGGLMLLSVETADKESVLPLISHGIGVYCIGKGVAVLASLLMGSPYVQKVEVVQTQPWTAPPR